jgi:peptidyl-prolyl cis-trans isomerase D
MDKLKMMLSTQGMSSPQFTAQVAKQLVDEQYIRGVSDSAFVTKQQLEEFYKLRNQERQIDYFTIPLAKTAEGEVSDKAIESYYQAHKSDFQNPEKLSVEYVSLSLDDVSGEFQATEDELKALYEEQKSQYGTPERKKFSHILISADMDKEDAVKAALAKVEQIRQRLEKGEDFAKVAKETSDDKESGNKGGDLGFIEKDAMDPNFSSAAFALSKDQISQPVKTPFGFHLIKLTEVVPATTKKFEEVRAELAKNYQRTAAENKFYDAKQKLDELSFEHNDSLESVAKTLNLKIAQTSLFTREAGDGIAAEALIRNAAFSPEVLDGKNSEAVEIGTDKVYVLHLKEHQPASDKPLADVKTEITGKLRNQQSQEATRKLAEQLEAEVTQGKKTMEEAAKSVGAALTKATVKLVGKTELPQELITAVNKAPLTRSGKPTPVLTGLDNGAQTLFVLTDVKDGSLAAVDAKEIEMAKDYLARNSGQAELEAYLDVLRAQTKVKINTTDKE